MSVDLSLIIPNNCSSLRDKDDAKKCFEETIERVIKYFRGRKQFVTEIIINQEEIDDEEAGIYETIEYSFRIPLLNITAYMHAGFWDIWINARYSGYFYPYEIDTNGFPRIWPRENCFNTLLVFGCKEGWVCDEYHSWNSNIDEYESTFEEWMAYGESQEDSMVHEFNVMDFADVDPYNNKWPNYKCKYHDSFKEYHEKLSFYKKKFPEYNILTIDEPLDGFLFVSKDENLYLLNIETGERFTDFPIDNCRNNFNGAGFQIFRGEKSAFFNNAGKQLTDFRVGDFSWEWDSRENHILDKIITDLATGTKFLLDGTPYVEKDKKG